MEFNKKPLKDIKDTTDVDLTKKDMDKDELKKKKEGVDREHLSDVDEDTSVGGMGRSGADTEIGRVSPGEKVGKEEKA